MNSSTLNRYYIILLETYFKLCGLNVNQSIYFLGMLFLLFPVSDIFCVHVCSFVKFKIYINIAMT